MSDLTPDAIVAADPSGMLGDVVAQPAQLADALWRVESAGIAHRDAPGGLCVCGMGGSAIGADLARAVLGERAIRPVRAVRGYSLEPGTSPGTVVLCSSYSGDTEEMLACFDAAGEAGLDRIALTTGGELASRARAAGVPVIGVPSGMQPRAAVVYMTIGVLACASACGAAPSLRTEIEAAAPALERLAAEWTVADAGSLAHELARRLAGTVPVVHGAGRTAAVAGRWKAQLNENAKAPAFRATLPEADHNELCAWEDAGATAPLSAVFLDDADLEPRLRRRIELTAATIEAAGARVERVEARGDSPFERVMSLVLLGDLVSVYWAVLAGRDPTPVLALERFKRALSDSAR